jgi:hypothetical protein
MPLKKFNPGSCDWCNDPVECPPNVNPCADTFLEYDLCEGDFNYTPAYASNWSASDSVTTGDRRKATAAVGGFSVGEVILSLSNRTTGGTFDATEALNWEAEGCVTVYPEYWTIEIPEGFVGHPDLGESADDYDPFCASIPAGAYELALTGPGVYSFLDIGSQLLITFSTSTGDTVIGDLGITYLGTDPDMYVFYDAVPASDYDCMSDIRSIGIEYEISFGSGFITCRAPGPIILTRGPLVAA